MADELTPAGLASRVPMASWTLAAPVGEVDRWFTVLEFDESRKALVLTASGRWAWTSTGRSGQVDMHDLRPPDVVGVLPVLELDPEGLKGKLADAAAVLRTSSEDLVLALPTIDLFTAALATRSDYWIDRALAWMEALYWRNVPAVAMQAVVDDPNVSQTIRHRARKLLSMLANG